MVPDGGVVTSVVTEDGLELESAWSEPTTTPRGVAVLCHPHPQHGGTMEAPLIRIVAGAMADAGLKTLRFNFRGVGRSEGAWGGGEPEIVDVAAAAAAARESQPDLPFGIAGWSFGAVTALSWQLRKGDTSPLAAIAPALDLGDGRTAPTPEDLPAARRLFIIGDRDQFTASGAIEEYATAAGGTSEVLAGSDHFFYFREAKVAALVAAHLLSGHTE